ncbi:MAG: zinc ribbon domain-containing protein [Lautropia sp.]|nr:zinc ribbon domain-containing protein [Lautropia sp.]
MPLYDYLCPDCGPFDAMRRINQRNAAYCPECGLEAPLALLHAPHIRELGADRLAAHAINERARHEPRSSSDGSYRRLSHPAGCGCCAPAGGKAAVSSRSSRTSVGGSADGAARMFPGRRPWMISH